MDFIKIVLTLCLGAFLGLLSFLFANGPVEAMRGGFVLGPNPGAVRVMQWLCGIPAILFGLGALAAVRSAWRQWKSPTPASRAPVRRATLSEAAEMARDHRKAGEFDLSRLTGAGWLLGLTSALGPPTLLANVLPHEFLEKAQKLAGFVILALCVTVFTMGWWLLSQFGIRLVKDAELPEDSDPEGDVFDHLDD